MNCIEHGIHQEWGEDCPECMSEEERSEDKAHAASMDMLTELGRTNLTTAEKVQLLEHVADLLDDGEQTSGTDVLFMGRAALLEGYDTNDHGLITSPGKFEGQLEHVVLLHEMVLYGMGVSTYPDLDEFNEMTDVTVLELSDQDRKEWPTLDGLKHAEIWQNDQGFLHWAALPGYDDQKRPPDKEEIEPDATPSDCSGCPLYRAKNKSDLVSVELTRAEVAWLQALVLFCPWDDKKSLVMRNHTYEKLERSS